MAGDAGTPESGKALVEPASLKDVIGSAASAVSIVSAAAFILSVIYEWAYFSVVGQKFRSIAALSDYLTNALDWLPGTIVGVAVGWGGLFLFAKFSERSNAQKRPSKQSGDAQAAAAALSPEQRQKRLLISAIVFTLAGVGFGGLIYFSDDPGPLLAVLATTAFTFFWLGVFGLVVFVSADPSWARSKLKFAAFFLIPLLAVGVFFWGLQNGIGDLNKASGMYRLIRKDSQAPKGEDVNVLRTFDRGVLVRLPAQQINEFLRWDEIRSLSLKREGLPDKSLSCRQFGFSC